MNGVDPPMKNWANTGDIDGNETPNEMHLQAFAELAAKPRRVALCRAAPTLICPIQPFAFGGPAAVAIKLDTDLFLDDSQLPQQGDRMALASHLSTSSAGTSSAKMSKDDPVDPPPYPGAPAEQPSDSKIPSAPGQDYVHTGDSMNVNLGPMWNLAVPAYGRGGSVRGKVELKQDAHAKSVEAKATLGELAGPRPVRFIEAAQTLRAEDGYAFAFPLPACVDINGVQTPLPPSFSTTTYDSTCTIVYMLKIELSRTGLRRHETVRLPVSYFPRSMADQMAVDSIPIPADATGEPFADDASIVSIALKPSKADRGAIYLSIPAARAFASGKQIPFLLTLFFPDAPATAKLLSSEGNIRIALRRRTRIGLPDSIVGKDVESVEKTLGRAEIREIKSGKEGVLFVSGSIGTGERGQEANWAVPDFVPAPASVANDVPSWDGDIPVTLATDGYGEVDDSMPALQMGKLVPKPTAYQISRYAL
ncbi:hypothetical protein HWV62_16686 [Athelia sp. TMB]|nr:hypothetical protein HWV62_16686 [Athelia sp. TMB]